MKRLEHPNIVKLHYILEDTVKGKVRPAHRLHFWSISKGFIPVLQMYMVMDYVEGGSVAQKMTGDDGVVRSLSEETARK